MLLGKLTRVKFFVEGPKLWFKKKDTLTFEICFTFFPILLKYLEYFVYGMWASVGMYLMIV